MHRKTGFGIALLLMAAGTASSALLTPDPVSLLLLVPALLVGGMGVGVLTGHVESPTPDEELDSIPNGFVVVALAVGTIAVAGLVVLVAS